MKVILFDPFVGGHHVKYASYIVRHLIKSGDEVIFITWKPDKALEELYKQGAVVRYILEKPNATGFGGNTARRLYQFYRVISYSFNIGYKERADVVHHLYLERSELPLYFKILGTRRRSWKLFATFFWPYFVHNPQEMVEFPKRVFHGLNRWALGQMLKQKSLDGLFVHTDNIKQVLIKLYGDDSLGEQIFVVPDPIEPMEQIPQIVARKQLGLPQEKPLVLFFGGLRWDKGPDIFLESLLLLDSDWYAVIAGEPGYIGEAEVKQYFKRLKNPERLIARLGYVPDKDVPYYFSAVDVVVLPYRKVFKGTSGVLQHATAAGKPVIVTDVGEVGPTVRKYGLGIIVESESPRALAEAIQEFIRRKDEFSSKIRSRALQYAESNNWEIMAKKVREAYLFLLRDK